MIPNEQMNERRRKWRFGIQRELRYKQLHEDRIVCAGSGRTIDISSTGVAFLGEHSLTAGAFIELSISWPVALNESCLMRLIIFGRVVRSSGLAAACTIDKYEFRTQARSVRENPIPIRSDAKLRRWADAVKGKVIEARASA